MDHESAEWELFQLDPMRNVEQEAQPHRDPLSKCLENLEAELAGVPAELLTEPILPNVRVRLRSERHEDWEEPVEKRAGERRKIALALFIKSRLALGETLDSIIAYAQQHSREVANEMRLVVAEGWLEKVEA